jgi:hypothetical protein
MLTSSNLRSRERAGLVIAIVALAIALNPLNRQVRIWLRDVVVGGVPFWLDHLLFMVTLMVVVWGLIGFLLLGPRGLSLGKPERPREAWLAGLVSGLGLTALVMAALASLGALVFEPHPNWPVLFANFVSKGRWHGAFPSTSRSQGLPLDQTPGSRPDATDVRQNRLHHRVLPREIVLRRELDR